jgi:hypothetical protein
VPQTKAIKEEVSKESYNSFMSPIALDLSTYALNIYCSLDAVEAKKGATVVVKITDIVDEEVPVKKQILEGEEYGE